MRLLWGGGALIAVLAVEALLSRLAPGVRGHLDLMLLPLVWYASRHSQRMAMLVGCAGGLLQDAWFQAGVFGINGFKKTLLGWSLGGVASWIELDHTAGRFMGGAVLSLADHLVHAVLSRLMNLPVTWPGWVEAGSRAAIIGLLCVLVFPIMERWGRREPRPRPVRRRT